ncbi:cache domain-containing protein [Desulfobacula phenolica]|uniref:histidine kinase n=1 Tax=Desulfobacula phenolica TaxID=90732 RepID=A0A1H2FFP8_9BACT|nr:cache domain-containing protein [Desulfobacula phenolica]SDU06210.1 HAMP domain-containing protein [Desulfobacula phenolica]
MFLSKFKKKTRLKTIRSKILTLIIGLMVITSMAFTFITTKNYQRELTAHYHRLSKETLASTIRIIDSEYNDLLSYEINSIKTQRLLMENTGTNLLLMINSFYDLHKTGFLTEQTAKELCLKNLEEYRYQKNNYFFVYDLNLNGLSHPNKDMVGKNWSGFEDLKKRDALRLVRESLKTEKKKFTVFMWPRLEDMKPVKQIGFFMYYPQWKWIIGTALEMGYIEKISCAKEKQILSKLNKILGQVSLSNVGGILIFNSHGKIILHTSNLKDIDLKPSGRMLNPLIQDYLKESAGNFKQPVEYPYTNKSQEQITQSAFVDYFKSMDWYVAAFVDNHTLKKPGSAIAARHSAIIFIISLIGIAFAVFISTKIASPLADLTQYSKNLANSNFKLHDDPLLKSIRANDRNDEIKQLADAFAFMESELKKNLLDLKNYQQNLEHLIEIRTKALSDTNKDLTKEIQERKRLEEKHNKLIKELQKALDNVKMLSGLLPICSNCNKIRNDKGDWDELEDYIENHSDVLFTHGLCTACADKLYGHNAWYIKSKKKQLRNQDPPHETP